MARDFDIDDVRREVRKLLDPLSNRIDANSSDIESLTASVNTTASAGVYAEIVNLLNDSHPEWSRAAYDATGVLPADAGDTNLEAKNWYRTTQATTNLGTAAIDTLKAPKTLEPADHTLWAANENVTPDIPRWDKVNGTMEIGGAAALYDIYAPIPNDVVFPGQIFYVQFEAMLRTSTAAPSGLQAYCGIWDNTVSERKYIEGGTFAITDDQGNDPGVTYGIPGATSVDYRVLAYTDSGEQALSNVLNFPNASATLDGNNHPRIKFSGVPGFIRFEIYRKIGSTYVLQYTVGNTIEGVYYDVGNPPQATVSGWPTVTGTRPRAYAITTTFTPGSLTGLGWVRHAMTIYVPTTYNRKNTETGMQYFRLGLSAVTTDERQILIRRIGLSMGSGKWARSAEDVRTGVHSTVSTTASGAGSSGGGGIEPPPPGGGGGAGGGCALLDSRLSLAEGTKELGKAENGDYTDSGGAVCGRIRKVRIAQVSRIFWVTTESGQKKGVTFDHPFITSPTDFNGTPCEELKTRLDAGEDVFTLTRSGSDVISDRIVSIDIAYGDFWVGIPMVEGPHTIIINNFLCHNKIPIE